MPSLSIITASLNAAQQISRLIISLENQSSDDFEWIVIDGGSTDSTAAIVNNAKIRQKTFICEPDRGIYDALNKGIRLAKAKHYLVVGADDQLTHEAVRIYVDAILANPKDLITAPIMTGSHVSYPSPKLSRFRSGPPKVSAHSVGTVIKKSLHEIHGDYSLNFPIAADTHFLRKVVRATETTICYLPDTVGKFGTEGCSSKNMLRTLSESFAANVAAGEPLFLQWFLFSLRLLKNLPKIKSDHIGL